MKRLIGLFVVAALTTACVNGAPAAPFSYAADRCAGAQNQCQLDCAGIDDNGPARAACTARCLDNENRCYATGETAGSSVAVGAAVGEARTRREKEAAFQRWKRQKQSDAAAQDAAKAPVENQ